MESLEDRRMMTTTLYWDPSGSLSTSGSRAGGTWDTTTPNWFNPSTPTADTTWVTGDIAVFTGGSGSNVTVTIASSSISAAEVKFVNGGYTIAANTGDSLPITGSGQIDVASGISDTITAPLNGSNGLTLTGSGTLVLNDSNSYTGGTAIDGGTLKLAASTAIGSGSIVIDNTGYGGTLDLYGQSVSNSLSSTGTYYGGTIANSNSSTPASLSGTVSVASSGLTVNASGGLTLSGVISGSGGLIESGSATLTLSGTNTFTGGTTINAGTLQVGNSTALGSTSNALSVYGGILDLHGYTETVNAFYGGSVVTNNSSSNATLVVGYANGSSTNYGTIENGTGSGGTVSIEQSGTGQLKLGGTDSSSGWVMAYGGTLQMGSSTALGSNTSLSISGATFDSDGYSETFNSLDGYSAVITNSASGTTTLITGASNGGGSYNGTIENGTGAGGGVVDLEKAGTGSFSLSGTESSTGWLEAYGGTLTLYGSPSCAIWAFGGTLQMASSTALASTPGLYLYGATLDLNGNNESLNYLYAYGGAIITSNTSGTATLTIDSGNFSAGTIENGSGTVALDKETSGTLTLAGTNTSTGGMTINLGNVYLGSSSALYYGGELMVNAGTLDLEGYSQTIGALASTGAYGGYVTSSGSSATLTIDSNTSSTFSGSIEDGSGLSLVKEGAGTETFGGYGSNSYSGGTTIDGGTLQLGNSAAPGSGTITLNKTDSYGSTLDLFGQTISNALTSIGSLSGTIANSSSSAADLSGTVGVGSSGITVDDTGALTLSGVISGSGSLTKTGAGTAVLNGADTYTGGTTISSSGGILELGYGGSVTGGITDNATLALDYTSPQSVGNAISGSGGVNIIGSATVTVTTVVDTYSGTTNIEGGTLKAGNTNYLDSSSTYAISTGCSLDLGGYSQTIGCLSGNGMVTSSTSGSMTLTVGGNNSPQTFSGVIQNGSATALALTKTGTSTLILTGNSTATGAVTISNGTLQLGDGTSNNGCVTGYITDNSALLFAEHTGQTYSGVIFGTGTVTVSDAGAVTLNGWSDYSGTTTVSSGATLQAGVASVFSAYSAFTVSGTLDLGGYSQSIVSIAGGGTIQSYSSSSPVLTLANSVTTFSGNIYDDNGTHPAGTLGLTKNGSGTFTFSGYSDARGTVTVNAGTLQVTGALLNPITINSGGTVGGSTGGGGSTEAVTGAVNNAGGTFLGQIYLVQIVDPAIHTGSGNPPTDYGDATLEYNDGENHAPVAVVALSAADAVEKTTHVSDFENTTNDEVDEYLGSYGAGSPDGIYQVQPKRSHATDHYGGYFKVNVTEPQDVCFPCLANELLQDVLNAGTNFVNAITGSGSLANGTVAASGSNSTVVSDGGVELSNAINWTNSPTAYTGVNGNGVVNENQPQLIPITGGGMLYTDGVQTRWFVTNGSGTWVEASGTQDTLIQSDGNYLLTDSSGNTLTFGGSGGQMTGYEDANGNSITMDSGTSSGVAYSDEKVNTTVNSVLTTDDYHYVYGSDGNIASVTLTRKIGTAAAFTVQSTAYTYYSSDDSFGNPGDLELALTTDGDDNLIDATYYRYYTTTDTGSGAYANALESVYSDASYTRLLASLGSYTPTTSGALAAADGVAKSTADMYADEAFKYDSLERVTSVVMQGTGCSVCDAGLGTYTYDYSTNNSAYLPYYSDANTWATETKETDPNGNETDYYLNGAGNVLYKAEPLVNGGSTEQVVTAYRYYSDNQLKETISPSAISSFYDGSAIYNDSSGLVTIQTYSSGLLQYQEVQQGYQSGSISGATPLNLTTYTTYTDYNGSTVIQVASTATYADGSTAQTTGYSYDYDSGQLVERNHEPSRRDRPVGHRRHGHRQHRGHL